MTSHVLRSSSIGVPAPNFRIQEFNAHKMMQSLLALDDEEFLRYNKNMQQKFKQKYEAEWLRRMYGVGPRKLGDPFDSLL